MTGRETTTIPTNSLREPRKPGTKAVAVEGAVKGELGKKGGRRTQIMTLRRSETGMALRLMKEDPVKTSMKAASWALRVALKTVAVKSHMIKRRRRKKRRKSRRAREFTLMGSLRVS